MGALVIMVVLFFIFRSPFMRMLLLIAFLLAFGKACGGY